MSLLCFQGLGFRASLWYQVVSVRHFSLPSKAVGRFPDVEGSETYETHCKCRV